MNFSRPYLIFAATWLITFALAAGIQTNLSVEFPFAIYVMVFGSIAIFYASYLLMRLLLSRPIPPSIAPPDTADLIILSAFNFRLFVLWAIGFAATIAYSGGIPLYWRFIGDARNYLDFGTPTLSGLLNMFRAFIVAGTVALIVHGKASPRDYAVGGICAASAFAEISRGSIIAVILHGAAMIILYRQVRLREILLGCLGLWVFVLTFEYIGNNRTMGFDVNYGEVLGGRFAEEGYLSNYVWTFIYITSPFNNLAYALGQNFTPPMTPYYTFAPLLPSIIRNQLFTPGDYPIDLLNEAFNATTAYAPMVADFGPWLAMAIFAGVCLIISTSYVLAQSGSLMNQLIYPAIFTSVTLSFFYAYFFALPIVGYPILAVAYVGYRARVMRKVELLRQQAT